MLKRFYDWKSGLTIPKQLMVSFTFNFIYWFFAAWLIQDVFLQGEGTITSYLLEQRGWLSG